MRNPLFHQPLVGGGQFHIYSRTNNKEAMFKADIDRLIFLEKLYGFIKPFAHILSYNLQYNHFHLVIEVLLKDVLNESINTNQLVSLPPGCQELILDSENNMELILQNRFSAFLESYVSYINTYYNRKGNFFSRPYCRKAIDFDDYFKNAVFYVHNNSVGHNILTDFRKDIWTSYHDICIGDKKLLSTDRLFEYFGGEAEFHRYHLDRLGEIIENSNYVIEEKEYLEAVQKEEESQKKHKND